MKKYSKYFRTLGRVKVYGDVARYYLALIQFVLIAIGFIKYMDYALWLVIIICISFPLTLITLVYFHTRFIMPNEFRYLSSKNPYTTATLKALGTKPDD